MTLDELRQHEHWQDEHGRVRLMGVVEGYCVGRRRGAAPMLLFWKEWIAQFRPVDRT
jgi:hypothetical protein